MPEQIETERLLLRVRTVADVEDIFDYASLPEVSIQLAFHPVKSLEDEIYYLEHILPERNQKDKSPSRLWNCCQRDGYQSSALLTSTIATRRCARDLGIPCTQTIGVAVMYQKRPVP